ncbi:NACHT, LRR and PYD domains-containing protein 12-like [Siphateles boraxobius]|uniref:NACHT, LRR and PYD domains-containing protein 12-like n=1 Tax=Siphateles boraxobius TaxID=180520 RepID=UPI0040630F5B
MGNLLPNAQIWITSRPAAANQIPVRFIDRVTEIQGFNDEQKEEYFRKSISDQIMANKVISHIQKSPRINSMCYSPDYCRIIAAIPEEMFRTDETGSDFPKTVTQMYSKLLLAQTELNPERRETIIALGKITLDLLINRKSLFCDEDYELSAERVKASSSIIKVIDEKRKSFSFMNHRTQEFLAALYVTDVINGGNPLHIRDLSSLKLELGEQCFTHYNSLQKVFDSTLQKLMDLFFCFLLGFRLKSSRIALKDLLTQRSRSSPSSQIIQHIKTMIMNSSSDIAVESSLLFDALKELDERSLIQEIKTRLKSGLGLSPDEFSALMIVLLNSEEKLEEFKHHQSQELKPRPVLKTSGEHELRSCDISDGGCAVLSSALRSNPSHLRELDLSENDITDSGVMHISDLPENPQCKLEKLGLRSCHISDGGCAVLSSALRLNPSLRELDLSENVIKELGVKILSDLLADPQCKLEKLGLRSCRISDGGCAVLSSALRSNPSHLRELDLSENNITESEVKQISALLEHPRCKLEKLGLRSCHISDGGCAVLSSALRLNPSLRELDLSENVIKELGVKILSDLLADPQCKLEKLGLRSCRISDGGCAVLSSALRLNPSLRELDLSENVIKELGVKILSDLLADTQCKLEKLGLRSCHISDRGCAVLSSALRSNPSLR